MPITIPMVPLIKRVPKDPQGLPTEWSVDVIEENQKAIVFWLERLRALLTDTIVSTTEEQP